jgi:hypothetical protein
MFNNFFSRKSRDLLDTVEKYSIAVQDTDNIIIAACALYAGQIKIRTHTRNMLYLMLFHGNSDYANAPQSYVYTYVASLVCYLSLLQVYMDVILSLILKIKIYKIPVMKPVYCIQLLQVILRVFR